MPRLTPCATGTNRKQRQHAVQSSGGKLQPYGACPSTLRGCSSSVRQQRVGQKRRALLDLLDRVEVMVRGKVLRGEIAEEDAEAAKAAAAAEAVASAEGGSGSGDQDDQQHPEAMVVDREVGQGGVLGGGRLPVVAEEGSNSGQSPEGFTTPQPARQCQRGMQEQVQQQQQHQDIKQPTQLVQQQQHVACHRRETVRPQQQQQQQRHHTQQPGTQRPAQACPPSIGRSSRVAAALREYEEFLMDLEVLGDEVEEQAVVANTQALQQQQDKGQRDWQQQGSGSPQQQLKQPEASQGGESPVPTPVLSDTLPLTAAAASGLAAAQPAAQQIQPQQTQRQQQQRQHPARLAGDRREVYHIVLEVQEQGQEKLARCINPYTVKG